MPFAVAAAGVGVAGSLIGGAMQSSAIKSGQDQANAQYQQQIARTQPWVDTGGQANTQTANLLGLNGQDAANQAMSTYQQSPGYAWQMQQGLRATDAGAAATGMLRSGAALKAEQTFGQGLANSDFSQYYNRLANLSTTGANAAAGDATTANAAAQTDTSAAAAQSSIYGNEAKSFGTQANSLLSSPQFQSWYGGLGGGGAGSAGPTVGSPYTPSIYGVPSPY
jgi:hypothetical protein